MVYGNSNKCRITGGGVFNQSGSTQELYLVMTNQNNQTINDCFELKSEVIKSVYPTVDDCGCPKDDCSDGSLKIKINKKRVINTCGYSSFVLDRSGLVTFTVNNGMAQTQYMSSECCSALGYTPEVKNGYTYCRWKVINPCDGYTPVSVENGYQIFLSPTGQKTQIVPSASCCPAKTTPMVVSGGYNCYNRQLSIDNTINNNVIR